MEGGGLGKSWKVEAGTERVKVGMSELEMLFRPAVRSTLPSALQPQDEVQNVKKKRKKKKVYFQRFSQRP
jgi:hypothetical protein